MLFKQIIIYNKFNIFIKNLESVLRITIMKNQLLESDLSERLKHLRKSKNLTQEHFAEIIGVSRTAVAKWENGYAEPTLQNIVRISEMFDISSDYLLGISVVHKDIFADLSVEATYALKKFIFEILKTEEKQ